MTLENVSVDLDGTPILKNVTADIARGQITALFGLNGSGKTTLLRAVLKEIPYRGKIAFHCGHDHRQPAPQHVGYVPQRLRLDTNFPFTVRDFLAVSLSRWPLFIRVSRTMEARPRSARSSKSSASARRSITFITIRRDVGLLVER